MDKIRELSIEKNKIIGWSFIKVMYIAILPILLLICVNIAGFVAFPDAFKIVLCLSIFLAWGLVHIVKKLVINDKKKIDNINRKIKELNEIFKD